MDKKKGAEPYPTPWKILFTLKYYPPPPQFCEYRDILIARINCMFNYKYVEVLQIFLNNTNVPVDNLLLFRQMTKQV